MVEQFNGPRDNDDNPDEVIMKKRPHQKKQRRNIRQVAEVLARKFPEAEEYKEIPKSAWPLIYPPKNEGKDTRDGKISRLRRISVVSHFVIGYDIIQNVLKESKRPPTWTELQKTVSFIAEHVVWSSRESLQNYISNLNEFLWDWSLTLPNADEGIRMIKKNAKRELKQSDPRSSAPLDANIIAAITDPNTRAEALLWAYSGLRQFHAEALCAADISIKTNSDINDDEILLEIPSDKATDYVRRSFSIR